MSHFMDPKETYHAFNGPIGTWYFRLNGHTVVQRDLGSGCRATTDKDSQWVAVRSVLWEYD